MSRCNNDNIIYLIKDISNCNLIYNRKNNLLRFEDSISPYSININENKNCYPNNDHDACGPCGPQGPTGPTGQQGPPGQQGQQGQQGLAGTCNHQAGPRGPKGDIGLKGDQGYKGDKGMNACMELYMKYHSSQYGGESFENGGYVYTVYPNY